MKTTEQAKQAKCTDEEWKALVARIHANNQEILRLTAALTKGR